MQEILKKYYVIMMGVIAASVMINFIIPFPFGFFIGIGIVFGINHLMANKLKQAGFNIQFGHNIKKKCVVCGKFSNDAVCSRCGGHSFKYE
jgi:uncharacterized membrane protein YdbT with pleckstrin-like domain